MRVTYTKCAKELWHAILRIRHVGNCVIWHICHGEWKHPRQFDSSAVARQQPQPRSQRLFILLIKNNVSCGQMSCSQQMKLYNTIAISMCLFLEFAQFPSNIACDANRNVKTMNHCQYPPDIWPLDGARALNSDWFQVQDTYVESKGPKKKYW